jgi:hypothetical protein
MRFWIIDEAVAEVAAGKITFHIAPPSRSLPPEEAVRAADREWYRGQIAKLIEARESGHTARIPLTRAGSSLRLGGGFLQTEGDFIVVSRRSADAHARPLVLAEAGGVFDTEWAELQEMFFAESAEIIRLDEKAMVCLPRLEGRLARYNATIEKETLRISDRALELRHAGVRGLAVEVVPPRNSALVRFGDLPPLEMAFAAEADSSSLELIGIMRYPDCGNLRYFDGECDFKGDRLIPLHREIHRINRFTGEDVVWQNGAILRRSRLEEEMKRIDLAKSGNRYVTEKLREIFRLLPFEAPALGPLL